MVLQKPENPAVALNLRHHYGKGNRAIPVIRSSAKRGAVIVENNPGAAPIATIATGNNNSGYFFLGQKRKHLLAELSSLEIARAASLIVGGGATASGWKGLQILEVRL